MNEETEQGQQDLPEITLSKRTIEEVEWNNGSSSLLVIWVLQSYERTSRDRS